MVENALISVIIPVYNGAEFLPDAVASVRAQAYAALEIIVVDDGSTDHTAQVVQTLGDGIRYIYQPNQGPAAARNAGLAAAQGELIAFLDADDLWPADKLAQQLPALAAAPDTVLVWGHTQICPYKTTINTIPAVAPNWMPLLGSILSRKEVFQQVGLFEPSLRYGEDVDWFIRLREQQLVIQKLPVITLFYRLRPDSMTYGKMLKELGLFENIRRTLHRRRTVEA